MVQRDTLCISIIHVLCEQATLWNSPVICFFSNQFSAHCCFDVCEQQLHTATDTKSQGSYMCKKPLMLYSWRKYWGGTTCPNGISFQKSAGVTLLNQLKSEVHMFNTSLLTLQQWTRDCAYLLGISMNAVGDKTAMKNTAMGKRNKEEEKKVSQQISHNSLFTIHHKYNNGPQCNNVKYVNNKLL